MKTRWSYAVVLMFDDGGQKFVTDYDTETRPRVGRMLTFGELGVYRVVSREDARGKGDGIGTLYVEDI